ncbi:recombinase family protein [Rothia endophytica]|uniref:recombinase family protein n=1 Tax=Rothia endophytica TaxID=1324766 RepID=UPI001F428685|nr:recombinase family protein [Rothia endophytica]
MKNHIPATPRRTAIYLRISLDLEMDGLAIERQREDCERLAQREGWTVVETYVDQSISAMDATKKRPGYDRMVADYEAGMFDAIVCWDLDRLTRQPHLAPACSHRRTPNRCGSSRLDRRTPPRAR